MKTTQTDITALNSQTKNRLYQIWSDTIGETWPISKQQFLQILLHPDSIPQSQLFFAKQNNKIIGYISIKWINNIGQIQLILVDPEFQRQGVGTALLTAVVEHFRKQSITRLKLGAGAYAYFWPGVPHNLPSSIQFFESSAWSLTEQAVDMVIDLSSYTLPSCVLSRIEQIEVSLSAANPGIADQILNFERENFPDWYDFYQQRLLQKQYRTILCALDEHQQIVGTVIASQDKNKWWQLLGEKVGGLEALGVKQSMRSQGIGFALAAKVTQIFQRAGLEKAVADYTYLVDWYGRLGYCVWRKYQLGSLELQG